jgi:hypothetical protein
MPISRAEQVVELAGGNEVPLEVGANEVLKLEEKLGASFRSLNWLRAGDETGAVGNRGVRVSCNEIPLSPCPSESLLNRVLTAAAVSSSADS